MNGSVAIIIEADVLSHPSINTQRMKMLYKPGKYLKLPFRHNPISPIFADLKIICKTVAKRLESVTPNITHRDHTMTKLDSLRVDLDAEKAFERVNLKVLLAVLQKFGFGNSFTD